VDRRHVQRRRSDRLPSLGADEFVHVLAPPTGSSRLTIDRSFTWGAYERLPDAQRPVGAYYSVRRWRAPEAALELSIVAHGAGGTPCVTSGGSCATSTACTPAPSR
jgi:NADPH-dependent ferric siderophore reductase